MNLAALQLEGSKLRIDPLRDVNQTRRHRLRRQEAAGRSGVFILGGGSPKNFMLQTEPQIQEVLGLEESGHDYFLHHRAAVSIGTNPHYGGTERRIEPFLLDFDGDLYGSRLVVELWERLRDEAVFDSEEALIEQIAKDVEATRAAVRPA